MTVIIDEHELQELLRHPEAQILRPTLYYIFDRLRAIADDVNTPNSGVSDGDYGDITVSGSGTTWTIDAGAVSLSKIVDASAQYRIMARTSSGSGDWQELSSSSNVFSILQAADYSAIKALLDLEIGTDVQAYDATLAALAGFNSNGILTQTAADTFTGRTITGTANQISVSNGDGVSGNPTLSTPQDIGTSSTPQFTGIEVGHASDTTLTRSGAGRISIEGEEVAFTSDLPSLDVSDLPLGVLYKTNNTAQTTTITAIATPVLLNATTTFKSSVSNGFSSPSAGRLRYDDADGYRAKITGVLSVDCNSGGGLFAEPQAALNGTVIDTNVTNRSFVSISTPFAQAITFVAVTDLTQNDYIETYIQCGNNTLNVDCFSLILIVEFLGWT